MPMNKLIWACFFSMAAVLFFTFLPDLKTKERLQKNDTSVAMALDLDDLKILSERGRVPLVVLLDQFKKRAVSAVALSVEASVYEERMVREHNFFILWRVGRMSADQLTVFLNRLKKGDGILSIDKKEVVGYPSQMEDVSERLRRVEGFLPLMEFVNQEGLQFLMDQNKGRLVKGHHLQNREVLYPQEDRWVARLHRAVKERWVRFLLIRLPVRLSIEQNDAFIEKIITRLEESGFRVSGVQALSTWDSKFSSRLRLAMAVFLGVGIPLLGFWAVLYFRHFPWWGGFILVSCFSVIGGVLIHALGASEYLAQGLIPLRGVKLQLIAPLLGALVIVLAKSQWRTIVDAPVAVKHVLGVGLVGFFIVFFYLMRSGNSPIIPVSDSERGFRDVIENILGVRPRFKEFFIGHPFFIVGLRLSEGLRAMIFLFVGVIGQISIVNTFMHFHVPLEICLLRSFHGLWIGILFSFLLMRVQKCL